MTRERRFLDAQWGLLALAVGLALWGMAARWGTIASLWNLSIFALVAALAVIDLRTKHLPNALTLGLMAIGVVSIGLRASQGQIGASEVSVVALGWVAFGILWRAGNIGGGDLKLLGGLALIWPDRILVVAMLLAIVLASGVGHLVMGPERRDLPLGVWIALGCATFLLLGGSV